MEQKEVNIVLDALMGRMIFANKKENAAAQMYYSVICTVFEIEQD